jgi:CENP-B N-terminal DNA-binding domain
MKIDNQVQGEILGLHAAGFLEREVADLVGCGQSSVCRVVRAAGFGKPSRPRLTPDEKLTLINERRLGYSAGEIARRNGVAATTVLRVLHRAGVPPRPYGERLYRLDQSAFDWHDDGVAYWTGFLFADGCVMPHRQRLSVSAHERDADHIRGFARFLGSNQPLTSLKDRPIVALSIHSDRLVKALLDLGLEPRKSFGNPRAADWLVMRPAFWAGVIDGDGWIGERRQGDRTTAIVALYGTPGLLWQYREFLAARVYHPNWRLPKPSRHQGSLFKVGVASDRAEALLRKLEVSPFRLARKAEISRRLLLRAEGEPQ